MDVQGVLWCSLPRFLPCFSFFGVLPIDARGLPPASPRAPGGAVSPGFCLLAVLPPGCSVFGCLPSAFGCSASWLFCLWLSAFCLWLFCRLCWWLFLPFFLFCFCLIHLLFLFHLFFAFSLLFHCFICLFCCSSFIFFLINIGPHDCDLVSPP